MNKKNHDPAFIPCGDSFEKMAEIRDDELDAVIGGVGTENTAGVSFNERAADRTVSDGISAPDVIINPAIPVAKIVRE